MPYSSLNISLILSRVVFKVLFSVIVTVAVLCNVFYVDLCAFYGFTLQSGPEALCVLPVRLRICKFVTVTKITLLVQVGDTYTSDFQVTVPCCG